MTRQQRQKSAQRQEQQQEALGRARGGMSMSNYPAIINGFAAMGIHDARPRDNVLTYNAWQAIGRQVRKGVHGIKVQTWIPLPGRKDRETGEVGEKKLRPRTATVFHISQTDKLAMAG